MTNVLNVTDCNVTP